MENYHNNIKKNIIAISIACYILGCGYYLNNIQLLDNHDNAKLIHEFYLYLRSVNTSESYQNQNIKALINMA